MFTSLASATLIVLGAVIAVLGFMLAGSMAWAAFGLAAVAVGGVLGLLDRRRSA